MANSLRDEPETAVAPSQSAGITAKKPSRPKLTQPPSSAPPSGGSSGSRTSSPPDPVASAGQQFGEGLKKPFGAAFDAYGKYAAGPTQSALDAVSRFGGGVASSLGYGGGESAPTQPVGAVDTSPGTVELSGDSQSDGEPIASMPDGGKPTTSPASGAPMPGGNNAQPEQFAGSYGASNIYRNTAAETPTFSNTPEGARLTMPPGDRPGVDNYLANTTSMAEGVNNLARRQKYDQQVESAQESNRRSEDMMRRNEIKRLMGMGFNRSDQFRLTPPTQEGRDRDLERRSTAAELLGGMDESRAERQFEHGQTQAEHQFLSQENAANRQTDLESARIRLTPPPQYLPDSEGNLARVQGTEARPVTGPGGKPFRQANDGRNAKRESFLSILEDLTPSGGFFSDEERTNAVEFARSVVSDAYGDDDPEEPTFREGDLVHDNVTGERYFFINGELVPYEAVPADRRPR